MRAQASYTITAVKDGNDLDSILMLWAKTTTNAAPAKPSGTNLNGWTEDMPEFESGAYVWTCNRVAISDPTASTPIYTYTDPVLDTHWKKLDELNKQGTEIKDLADKVVIRYYNTLGAETSFTLSDGELDLSFLKGQIDDAEKVATNFISMREDGGIEVGNKSGGSWTGYRSQMLASEFNILNAAGSVLASYGAQDIYLGKNSTDAKIHFCNGEAVLKYNSDEDHMEINTPDGLIIEGGAIIRREYPSPDGVYNFKSGLDAYDSHVKLLSEIYVNGNRSAGSSITLSGNIMTLDADGYIFAGAPIYGYAKSSNWYDGRDNALLRSTNNAGLGAWHPIISSRASSGTWDIGTYNNNFYFMYVPDSNYEDWNGNVSGVSIGTAGSLETDGGLYVGGNLFQKNGSGGNVAVLTMINSRTDISLGWGSYDSGVGKTYVMAGTELMAQAKGAIYLGAYTGSGYGRIIIGAQSTNRGLELKPETNNTCSLGWDSGRWKYAFINQIYTTNSVSVDSDKRLKKDISYDLSSLDKVIDLIKPATYKLIADDQELIRFGFIAQDAQRAFIDAGLNPDDYAFISKNETENGVMLSLGYTETNALLWHRQQQLEQRIAELEK